MYRTEMKVQFTSSRKSEKPKAELEGERSIHLLGKGGKCISERMKRTYKSTHSVCWENALRLTQCGHHVRQIVVAQGSWCEQLGPDHEGSWMTSTMLPTLESTILSSTFFYTCLFVFILFYFCFYLYLFYKVTNAVTLSKYCRLVNPNLFYLYLFYIFMFICYIYLYLFYLFNLSNPNYQMFRQLLI